jgi:glycosyltransferase involved in cell wall biosynthesis
MAAQGDCVVVDYGCPDGTADWVEAAFPQVTVVRAAVTGGFNPSHARNLGVEAARSDVVCLIDADVAVSSDFAEIALRQFDRRKYYVAEPLTGDISGTMLCHRAAFRFVEGYDEACDGWGGEDLDLYERFEFHGLERASFPASLLSALPHSDEARTIHHRERSKDFSNTVNLVYSHIKIDVMKLSESRLPLDYRRQLHADVEAACRRSLASQQPVRIEIPVADISVNRCEIGSTLAFTIDMSGHYRP